MEKLNFDITINATKEKVWSLLWDDSTYPQWTAPFCEGSYAESEWKEGSPIRFLSPGNNGMFGLIKKMEPNSFMSFEHLGEIRNGEEQKMDWGGALENYTLETLDNSTVLKVEVDITEAFKEYMSATFPQALNKLKQLAEDGRSI
jgi:uncharacterized protein YndB with AHSA1/START domain